MKKIFILTVLLAGLAAGLNADHAYAQTKISILQTGYVAGHLFACPT